MSLRSGKSFCQEGDAFISKKWKMQKMQKNVEEKTVIDFISRN